MEKHVSELEEGGIYQVHVPPFHGPRIYLKAKEHASRLYCLVEVRRGVGDQEVPERWVEIDDGRTYLEMPTGTLMSLMSGPRTAPQPGSPLRQLGVTDLTVDDLIMVGTS